MRTWVILSIFMTSSLAFAYTAQEEALILNQELQFLEESKPAPVVETASAKNAPTVDINTDENLERTYFRESPRTVPAQDSVGTKAAAPRRRGF